MREKKQKPTHCYTSDVDELVHLLRVVQGEPEGFQAGPDVGVGCSTNWELSLHSPCERVQGSLAL